MLVVVKGFSPSFSSTSTRKQSRPTAFFTGNTQDKHPLELVSTLVDAGKVRRWSVTSKVEGVLLDLLTSQRRRVLAELARYNNDKVKQKKTHTVTLGQDPLFIKLKDDMLDNDEEALVVSSGTSRMLVDQAHRKNRPHAFSNGSKVKAVSMGRQEQSRNDARYSLSLVGEINNVKKPGYLNIMPSLGAGRTAGSGRTERTPLPWIRRKDYTPLADATTSKEDDRLWVTGFSLAGNKGHFHCIDASSGHVSTTLKETDKAMLWPNEANPVPQELVESSEKSTKRHDDALLVSDGFLVPGKDKGGVYVVQRPGHASESTVCLHGGPDQTDDNSWFYHRSVWVDLTGDGRKSVLTCRAKMNPVFGVNSKMGKGELVWLEQPKPHHVDEDGTPREADGSVFDPFAARHLPWKAHVLDEGPDIMFSVADLDTSDDTIEVIASNFFDKKVTLHSIQKGQRPRISFRRTIDESCGAALSAILADLDGADDDSAQHHQDQVPTVVDCGSTVQTVKPGEAFSHVLVTSHEGYHHQGTESTNNQAGGSLYAYKVPKGKDAWKTAPWKRTRVASGFTVKTTFANMINPGAPGFVYTFHPRKDETDGRPMIAVAGDCAEKAYLFRPTTTTGADDDSIDEGAQYRLMAEIDVGATVGSIGIGYNDFCATDEEDGYAKLYIPAFEKDKIHVFALGRPESRG